MKLKNFFSLKVLPQIYVTGEVEGGEVGEEGGGGGVRSMKKNFYFYNNPDCEHLSQKHRLRSSRRSEETRERVGQRSGCVEASVGVRTRIGFND